MRLPPDERASLVSEVVLDPGARASRGITVPAGLVIQRSTFADARPTLFCVAKHLPRNLGWKKVTITFDNPDTYAASGSLAGRLEEGDVVSACGGPL